MLLRNRPAHVAAFLGVLLAGGTVVVINPSRGDDRTKDDIAALELPVIIGGHDDLAKLVGRRSRIDGRYRFRRSTPSLRWWRQARAAMRPDPVSRCGC